MIDFLWEFSSATFQVLSFQQSRPGWWGSLIFDESIQGIYNFGRKENWGGICPIGFKEDREMYTYMCMVYAIILQWLEH